MRPLGYELLEEKKAIERRLIAAGVKPDSHELVFEVERLYELAHSTDPSLRERQAREQEPAEPPESILHLTVEELERLVQHFAGANDPVAASIAAKAQQGLKRHIP